MDDPVFIETPLHRLSQYIGDFSQNVCGSSYNEDEVRSAWRNNRMNGDALHPCYTLDSAWPDAPKDFQTEMNRLVKEAGVWSLSWCSAPGDLTDAEKAMAGVPAVSHGDVLIGIIRGYPTTDPNYHEGVIVQIVYDQWAQLGSGEVDPETLVRAVLADPRFMEIAESNEEWKKQQRAKKPYEEFSYGMQYHLSTFSISFKEPVDKPIRGFLKNWVGHEDPGHHKH
jgi:hypothetical protein